MRAGAIKRVPLQVGPATQCAMADRTDSWLANTYDECHMYELLL